MGGAAGGAVSFHGVDGVNDRKIRIYGLSKLHQHPGEILDLRPAVVHLRFLKARNRSEKVLDAAGIAGHSMGLELANIDDIVCLHDRRDEVKAVIGKAFPGIHRFCGAILIQVNAVTNGIHTTDVIDPLHMLRRIGATGALRQRDILDPLLPEPFRHSFYHQRMGGYRRLRLLRHNEVGFDDPLSCRASDLW